MCRGKREMVGCWVQRGISAKKSGVEGRGGGTFSFVVCVGALVRCTQIGGGTEGGARWRKGDAGRIQWEGRRDGKKVGGGRGEGRT